MSTELQKLIQSQCNAHFCFELRNKIKCPDNGKTIPILPEPLTVNVNTEIIWQCHNRYPWNPILCLRSSNALRTAILFATPTICMTSLTRGNDVLRKFGPPALLIGYVLYFTQNSWKNYYRESVKLCSTWHRAAKQRQDVPAHRLLAAFASIHKYWLKET